MNRHVSTKRQVLKRGHLPISTIKLPLQHQNYGNHKHNEGKLTISNQRGQKIEKTAEMEHGGLFKEKNVAELPFIKIFKALCLYGYPKTTVGLAITYKHHLQPLNIIYFPH